MHKTVAMTLQIGELYWLKWLFGAMQQSDQLYPVEAEFIACYLSGIF
jgi:hypothetical protein